MLEKILFRRVEMWVLFLALLISLIGTILFGWIVKYVALGGVQAGAIGELAVDIASTPSILKELLSDKILESNEFDPKTLPSSPATKGIVSVYDFNNYKNVFPDRDNSPKYFFKETILNQEPLAIQARVSDRGDEILAIFNEQRHLVKTIDFNADSMMKKIPAKLGGSPFHIFNDGSYLLWPYGGVGLFRFNPCGEVIWQQKGIYHHHFSIADGKLYILGLPGDNFDKQDEKNWNHSDILNVVDIDTGEIVKSISISEIATKNLPDIDPLFYGRWKNTVNNKGVLGTDFLHLNKIEVLPNNLREQYPHLPAGALMVSARHINLLFILDPETLEIVWYSHGYTQVQHDPKFTGNNKISVFNNANSKNHPDPHDSSNFTSIRTYDFGTNKWETFYNMKSISGYTAHIGRFDISENNSLALQLTLQGRIVEIDSEGSPLFEFISYRDDNSVYWQKASQYLPKSAYDGLMNVQCN